MKKFTSIFAILAIAAFSANAQNISTYAGNGTQGHTGDGGPATAAEFGINYGVALDAAGNLYVADQQNNEIRKISTTGIMTSIAGNSRVAGATGDGGLATAAELNNPTGVSVDASGNIYIADAGNNKIRMINTSGMISTFAGTGAVGSSGDSGPATAAKLDGPAGVAVDAVGDVFIADTKNNKIRVVMSGTINTAVGTGTPGSTGDGGLANLAELNQPFSLTLTSSGMYIADQNNNKIRFVNTSGDISTFAGNGTGAYSGDGGQATAAELQYPMSVTVDKNGNVYIADQFNGVVRIINTAGVINTCAGNGSFGFSGDGGPATAAKLWTPVGLAIDGALNLYISDNNEERVRKVAVPLAVNEVMNNNGINIYPNPSNGVFTVKLEGVSGQSSVEVFNVLGEKVYSSAFVIRNSQFVINLSDKAPGIYLFKITTQDGSTLVKRLEVAR